MQMFSKFQRVTEMVKNPLNKLKTGIKDGIKDGINAFQKQQISCVEIVANKIFHIDYPTSKNIQSLKRKLQKCNQYQIWNISQYPYKEQILTSLLGEGGRNSDGKQIVYNLTFEFFANIPFCEMIKAIESIQSFLTMDSGNKVFIHCQKNKRRSSIFLSSYVFLTGIETDIVQSILLVNKILEVNTQDRQVSKQKGPSYKAQHMVLKNLMNYINDNSFIHKNTWFLKKILINNAPNIRYLLNLNSDIKESAQKQKKVEKQKPLIDFSDQQEKQQQKLKFRLLLEIRSDKGVIFKNVFDDEFSQGQSLCLRLKDKCLLKDDFLIIVKYVYKKKAYSILRTQFNTNFIYDNFVRVQRQDMDLSVKNSQSKNQSIFMDMELLENHGGQVSQLSKLSILKDKQMDTQSSEEKQIETMKKQSEDEDFKILDQEQLAEHNEKLDKQIEEQLKRQLQNMRKKDKSTEKKRQQSKSKQKNVSKAEKQASQNLNKSTQLKVKKNQNTQKNRKQNQTQTTTNNINSNNNFQQLLSLQIPYTQPISLIQTKKESQQKQQESITKAQEYPKVNQQNQHKQQQEEQADMSQQAQQSESEKEQSLSSEEEDQAEDDLDDYLAKLEKEAEKS